MAKILQLLMLLTAGFAACSALYFLVDNGLEGFFVDWFEDFFTMTEGHFNLAEGTGEIWHTINWGRLKPLDSTATHSLSHLLLQAVFLSHKCCCALLIEILNRISGYNL